jgi:hypothetical protein
LPPATYHAVGAGLGVAAAVAEAAVVVEPRLDIRDEYVRQAIKREETFYDALLMSVLRDEWREGSRT